MITFLTGEYEYEYYAEGDGKDAKNNIGYGAPACGVEGTDDHGPTTNCSAKDSKTNIDYSAPTSHSVKDIDDHGPTTACDATRKADYGTVNPYNASDATPNYFDETSEALEGLQISATSQGTRSDGVSYFL